MGQLNDMYLVLDQGTSSTKVFLINDHYKIYFNERIKHHLQRPKPHHVEIDPLIILEACYSLMRNALQFAEANSMTICAVGMAIQRSTFLFWDKVTGVPLSPAISWQDSRAVDILDRFQSRADWVESLTGTPLSAHFGAPKFVHLIKNTPSLRKAIKTNSAWFGTLSSFLIYQFTGVIAQDETIAGRSLLMNLNQAKWDPELCAFFDIPLSCLPPLIPAVGNHGYLKIDLHTIPFKCVLGDQQAALLGQGGYKTGSTAMNFGTSGSVQTNTGTSPGHVPGLISSILFSDEQKRLYMLEGTINACNSMFYWLETELDIPHEQMKWYKRALNQSTEGIFVPGFLGIAAPYWLDRFETIRLKLDNAETNEIIRAAMESIGFLVYDIFKKILKKTDLTLKEVTASGGGSRPVLLQFLADMLGMKIGHTQIRDRTAIGVVKAMLWNDDQHLKNISDEPVDFFMPKMDKKKRQDKLDLWYQAIRSIK